MHSSFPSNSGVTDAQCDELEEDRASFSCDMADTTLKDLELPPQDAAEDSEAPTPQVNCTTFYFM
jgi:hypothetical protein